MDLLPIRKKSCYEFLASLEIHSSRPSFNPRILGPTTNTLITRPPRDGVRQIQYNANQWSKMCNVTVFQFGFLPEKNNHLTSVEFWVESVVTAWERMFREQALLYPVFAKSVHILTSRDRVFASGLSGSKSGSMCPTRNRYPISSEWQTPEN
jgi:hypothetical protein